MISLMFANNWIYGKVELSQYVNMKHNDKFYWYACDNRFLITPVANVLMRLGCQSKGTEDFRRPADSGKHSKGSMWLF